MDNVFGTKLKETREDLGISQDKLARMLLVSKSIISRWENGKTMPDLSLMKPLCEILDVFAILYCEASISSSVKYSLEIIIFLKLLDI